jgi:uncharacterized protein (TIRG00374 family)
MSRPWTKFRFVVLAVIALGAVVFYSSGAIHNGFSWMRLEQAVAKARLSNLILAVVVVFVAFAMRALRWKRFCRSLGACSFMDVYRGTLMGFAGIVLLGRAGEPVRPLLLARQCRFPVASAFGVWFLERLFDLGATAVLLGLSLVLPSALLSNADGAAWRARFHDTSGVLLIGLAVLTALVIYFQLHGSGVLTRWLSALRVGTPWRRSLATKFEGFSVGLQSIRTFNDFLAAVFYSGAHWGLITLAYLLVAQSFGGRLAELDFRGAMLVLVFTLIGSTVQLPGVGGGNQVLSFIALTQVFKIAQEPAAAAAIVLWLVNIGPVCVFGMPLLFREGWSMADLRRLARSPAEEK